MTRLRLLLPPAAFLALFTAPVEGAALPPPPPIPHAAASGPSPDGKVLASAAAETILLRDATTNQELYQLRGHSGPVNAVAFAPDGRFLASAGGDGTARLWNVADGKELFVFRGHTGAVRALAFAPDGRLLATAGDDRTVRLWEMASGREVLQLQGQAAPGFRVAFRPDGRALLGACPEDGAVVAWDLAAGKQVGRWVLERLQVSLAEPLLPRGRRTALRVEARWAGGATQDVTRWAACDCPEDEVARLAAPGQVEARGPGRTVVTVRYLGRTAAVAVTVPYGPSADLPRLPAGSFVDEQLGAVWKRVGLRPAELVEDALFLRRAHLHLIGGLPTPDEVRRFQADRRDDKRARLVDALLGRPEYVDHWARKWGELLGTEDAALGVNERGHFRAWVRRAVQDNWPADRLARSLLLAEGEVRSNGAAAFFLAGRTPEETAEATAEVLLGVDLLRARCHRHPAGEWGRDDYLGLAAFFAGVERQGGAAPGVRLVRGRELAHPVTGRPVAPRLPGLAAVRDGDPRRALAEWLTAKDNPHFGRNIVNRYWAALFGRGLVEPVDGLGPANPPCQPELLDALAQDFVRHGHDVKHLLRMVCASRTYQLDYRPALAEDKVFFSRRAPQRLPEDTLARIVAQAAGIKLEVMQALRTMPGRVEAEPASFHRRRREERRHDRCERPGAEPITPPAFPIVFDNDGITRAIAHPEGRLGRLLAAGARDEQIIEELFLATLSRPAKPDEGKRVRDHVAKAQGAEARKTALQDVLWALLNSGEFLVVP